LKSLIRRSSTLLVAGLLVAASPVVSAMAQSETDYPNRAVTMLLPFAPGGSTDPLARVVAQYLSESMGQPVVVDNRPGGGTVIGTDAAAKSAPDGYTMLYTASTHVINELLMEDLPYDSFNDFEPVATITRSDFVLVVHPDVPANTLEEFIELAKNDPDGINYAISGVGNPNQLAGEYFSMLTGANLNSVAYQGGGPGIVDLLGGHVQAMFSVPTSVIEHVKAGTLRALAHTSSKPLPGLEVPTFADAGLPEFDIASWNGIFVPADTPRPIIDKLSAEIGKVLEHPEVIDRLASQGQQPWYTNADDFEAHLQGDIETFGSIIEAANITLE